MSRRNKRRSPSIAELDEKMRVAIDLGEDFIDSLLAAPGDPNVKAEIIETVGVLNSIFADRRAVIRALNDARAHEAEMLRAIGIDLEAAPPKAETSRFAILSRFRR